jgi:hypothetical protein
MISADVIGLAPTMDLVFLERRPSDCFRRLTTTMFFAPATVLAPSWLSPVATARRPPAEVERQAMKKIS